VALATLATPCSIYINNLFTAVGKIRECGDARLNMVSVRVRVSSD